MQREVDCVYQQRCGGCPWIGHVLEDQKADKLKALSQLIGEEKIQWLNVGDRELRDRADLTFVRGAGLGLYHLTEHKIVDIEKCVMMSPALQAWYEDFRRIEIPIIQKGSVRLRVGVNGLRGVWLDFANVDVKSLLDEKDYLESLLHLAHVEIGQRRKVLGHKDGELKLLDPQFKPWFSTWVEGEETPLQCSIADFTQPSMKANKVLVEAVVQELKNKNIKTVIEFGAGIGNFTLPLASICEKIYALELESNFTSALKINLEEHCVGLKDKFEVLQGDYQNPNEKRPLSFDKIDAVLADPPRSGLKNFLAPLESAAAKPKFFIYVSCYPESFALDKTRLESIGYKLESLKVVDQFPQTSHAELIALFFRP